MEKRTYTKEQIQKKRDKTKRWRERVAKQGYHKYLYERRKLRFQDAEEFRSTLELIASRDCETLDAAKLLASRALAASAKREKEVGDWRQKMVAEAVEGKGDGPWMKKGKSDGGS